jgi:DNA-binding transcriptional LysR family regulator
MMAETSTTFDWDDLRVFLAASRSGTLAGAARALQVEHTTVGRRLARLERALGGALVLRTPEGIRLTALGERVSVSAAGVEAAIQAVHAAVGTEGNRVRMAVPSGFTSFFTSRLSELLDGSPPVELELVSSSKPVDLTGGEADLALRAGPVRDPELVAKRVGEVGWSLYASRPYLARRPPAADPTDLRGHQLIGYDTFLAETPAARWVEEHAAGATIALRSRELADMAGAAAAGVGIALLPCHLGDASAALVRLTPAVLVRRDLWLAWRRESKQSATVAAVLRFAEDVIAQGAPQLVS